MTMYSHSRLSSFEQCKFKFKLRYLDKIIPEIPKSIETHLGSVVHDTLQWLYYQLNDKIIPSIDEVIVQYTTKWEESYTPDMVIVKKHFDQKHYFNKGIEFLLQYYISNKPFTENTLDVEKKIIIDIEGYKLIGFIDRLVHNLEKDSYEIHDYKTANSLPDQQKVDTDRQLALYSIAIKELFGQDKEVDLVWHYLAHNKKIVSKRTNQQLEELKKQIIKLIQEIESTNEFPSSKSALCDWCEYKGMCPEFGGTPPEKPKPNTELKKYPTVSKYIQE